MTNNKYNLYGLNLRSELEFPELSQSTSELPEVNIQFGKVDSEGLEETIFKGLYCHTAEQTLWLDVQGIARFLVRNGNEIIIDAATDADLQSVRLYLLGSCMGAILQQRRFLVLHANTIAVGDKAVAFAGPSGQGKSTLAAAFHQRGYPILTDDVCAINEHIEVVPGYPQLKLWQDSAKKLNITTRELNRIRLQINKYSVPLKQGFAQQTYPITAVFFLHSHNEHGIRFDAAKGWECYHPLKANSYRFAYTKGMNLEKHHLKQCSKLSNKAAMWHLYRPGSGFELEKLIHELEQHFQKPGVLR